MELRLESFSCRDLKHVTMATRTLRGITSVRVSINWLHRPSRKRKFNRTSAFLVSNACQKTLVSHSLLRG
jgi:hypothetical protein